MILYRTRDGLVLEHDERLYSVPEKSLDDLIVLGNLHDHLAQIARSGAKASAIDDARLLPPIGSQEVWAAGVTYLRSRAARIAESKDAGGGDFYDRVYSAERPELFFKSLAHKVVGPRSPVGIRSDATWSVPEPELALLINPQGRIVGYTAGNDMSSRDIEGQNPLYLPQAKVYHRSCALGPGILIASEPLSSETRIELTVERAGAIAFTGATTLAQMKRRPDELAEYLYRDQTFPFGTFLLTGTGVVPPDSFTLHHGDIIRIAIDGIGALVNPVG
ncbi:MAG: fumarylacetoacetate hydrolase family protein [Acidobacteriaceae bacterium]